MIAAVVLSLLTAGTALPPSGNPPHEFSVETREPADPADSLPLEIGTRWTYLSSHRSPAGSAGAELAATWETEVVVRGRHDVPEGTVIERATVTRALRMEGPPELVAWLEHSVAQSAEPHLLLIGNDVYDLPELGWDRRRGALRTGWREKLERGTIGPTLCLPLGTVKRWSGRRRELADLELARRFKAGTGPAPNPHIHYWRLDGKEDVTVPYDTVPGAYLIVHQTLGSQVRLWVKPGLGVVRELAIGGGGSRTTEKSLVSFTPGARDDRSR
jgi:hypothetical protein